MNLEGPNYETSMHEVELTEAAGAISTERAKFLEAAAEYIRKKFENIGVEALERIGENHEVESIQGRQDIHF